jgi:predicted RNA methylase
VIEIGCGNLEYMSKLCWEQDPKSFTAIEENEKAIKSAKKIFNDRNKGVYTELINGISNKI